MNLNSDQFRQLLERYLEGRATADEQHLLDRFFSSYEKEVLAGSLHDDERDEQTRSEILEGILKRVSEGRTNRVVRFPFLKIAASLALIAVAAYFSIEFFGNDPVEVASPTLHTSSVERGQKLSLKLDDGSNVILNAGATMTYPARFDDNVRSVTLEGEGWFEVSADSLRPFIVRAGASITRVVGTSFNIKTRDSRTEVTLVEGSVMVSSSNGRPSTLKPNQQAIIDHVSSTVTTRNVDVERFVSWKDNQIYFHETRLADAVSVLENWYDVDISLENPALGNCVITAKYRDESLENILKSLQFLLNVEFDMTDRHKIIVRGYACK